MAKMIKFNLTLSGATLSTFDELQDNFSAEVLPIYRTGRLLKWLQARELTEQVQAVQAITPTEDDHALLGALCHALGMQADADVITFLLEDWHITQERHTAEASNVETVGAHAGHGATDGAEHDQDEAHTASGATVDWSGQDMTGRNFEGEDFSHGKFVGTNFSGSTLKGANFTGADLTGAEFTSGDLSRCVFANANLTDASFGGNDRATNLQGAIFVGAHLHNTSFQEVDLKWANFSKTEKIKVDFSTCDLYMANFESADLSFSDLSAYYAQERPTNVYAIYHATIASKNASVPSGAANFKNAKLTGVTGLTRSQADALTDRYTAEK